MVRRIVLSLASLAVVTAAFAITSSSEAGSWRHGRHHVQYPVYPSHHCHYKVLYRDCYCGSWSCYGTFHSHYEADQIACSLRYQGYEARVASW